MIGHLYTYSHPIFYVFMLVVVFIAKKTHKNFMQFYTKSSPYTNDKLDRAATNFLILGILFHLLFVGYT